MPPKKKSKKILFSLDEQLNEEFSKQCGTKISVSAALRGLIINQVLNRQFTALELLQLNMEWNEED